MVGFLKTLIIRTVNFYRGSSVKPFGNIFKKIYLKHIEPKMREKREAIATIDGLKYKLNLNQPSELETYYGGGYEPAVIRIIERYVKPGDTVIDIGARIGLHTFRMKKLAGPGGKVFAIEPDPETFARLRENARLNNHDIVAENIAFSDKNGEKEITLDAYAERAGIGRLNFIKLDTDGWEYPIIRGGRQTIGKFKPVMVVEFNRNSLESGSLEPMVDLLESLGYAFFRERSLRRYPDKKSLIEEVFGKKNINVLCQ